MQRSHDRHATKKVTTCGRLLGADDEVSDARVRYELDLNDSD
jgi:hypothetical protein